MLKFHHCIALVSDLMAILGLEKSIYLKTQLGLARKKEKNKPTQLVGSCLGEVRLHHI